MKPKQLIILALLVLSCNIARSQDDNKMSEPELPGASKYSLIKKKQLNFFIISKRKKGKLDLATRFNVARTKLKSLFRHRKFVSIIAPDATRMSAKVRYRLEKYNARIGTIWFDSHGMYKKGYSLFFIGHDEYSFKTLRDSVTMKPLLELRPFTDEATKVIIGSCYGGATYQRLSVDYKDTTRMNGDILMRELGKIFHQATIFGSESWVMSKPGLFLRKAAVGGYPGRKLFRDHCYQPAWENVGKWNKYNAGSNQFDRSNPIAMDVNGNLVVRGQSYLEEKHRNKNIRKNMAKLETGLYK